jgi:hypothetical protein
MVTQSRSCLVPPAAAKAVAARKWLPPPAGGERAGTGTDRRAVAERVREHDG